MQQALACKPDQSPDACAGLNGAAVSVLPAIITNRDDVTTMRASHSDAEVIAAFYRVADQLNMGRRIEGRYSNEDILRAVNTYKAEHGEELDLAGRQFFMLVWGVARRFLDGFFDVGGES